MNILYLLKCEYVNINEIESMDWILYVGEYLNIGISSKFNLEIEIGFMGLDENNFKYICLK